MGAVTLAFAIISGVLGVARDVIGIDVSLRQNQPGKVPLAAAFSPPPPATAPVVRYVSPLAGAQPRWVYDLARAPTRTMAPVWSPGDPR